MMIKPKIRTALLVLFALVFVLSTALLGLFLAKDGSYAEDNVITGVSVRIDDGIRVLYKVNLPENYSEPTLQIERGSHLVTLSSYEQQADGIVFSYGGVRVSAMDEEINATLFAKGADGERVKVEEKAFTVSNYFAALLEQSAEESGFEHNVFAYQAQRAFAACALNLGEKATGNTLLSLSQEDRKMLIFKDENRFNGSDWPLRDSMTVIDGTNAGGFEWVGLPAFDLNQGFYLRYNFAATNAIANDLKVKIDFLGQTHWTIPVQIGEQNGTPVYGFGYGFDATEFCFDAEVTVYNGATPVSATVAYSVNRALARGTTFGASRDEKALASAAWAFGKAVAWHQCQEEVEYVFLPNMTDNGIYTGLLYDYVYENDFLIAESMGKTAPAIWVDGNAYSAEELADADFENGYDVSYDNDVFTVNLNGVQEASGIVSQNGSVRLVVTADSSISDGYYRTWDDKNSRTVSTVGAVGDVIITGDKGATLTINGRLIGDNVTIQGDVKVVVLVEDSSTNGVEATKSVTLADGASLTARYVGKYTATNVGLRLTANLAVTDSQLSIEGFQYGIQFGGDNDNRELDFTVENSEINIESIEHGVTAVEIPGAEWNGWQSTNWYVTLSLTDGSEMSIDGGSGTRFVNVVLGDADFTINATQYGIGDPWAPATLTTTSGDYEVGTLTVTVTVSKPTKSAFAMVASAMDVNGGTVTFVSGGLEGVLCTTSKCVWNFANCDVIIRATSVATPMEDWEGVKIVRPYGVVAQSGGEQINIDTSAQVFVYDCDIAFACWISSEWSSEPPVKITVLGFLQIDNFFVPQWDWGLTAQFVDGNGNPVNINYTNQRSE